MSKVRHDSPDLSVRIPKDSFTDLQKMSVIVKLPLKRFVAELTMELLGQLGLAAPGTPSKPRDLIATIQSKPRLTKLAAKILARGHRTLPIDQTQPTRIHFTHAERSLLQHVTTKLHWAQSYVVWQAFYAVMELATQAAVTPDIIKLYRGLLLYEAATKFIPDQHDM